MTPLVLARRLAFATLLAIACADLPCMAQGVDCATPSGIGTHACTFPDGQIVIETSLIDSTIDNAGGLRTKSVQVGDTLVHIGLSRNLELQVGWDPYDYERTSDLKTGETAISSGVGDVTFGGKLALVSARDHPFGIAIQPSLVIPVGDLRLGAGKLRGGVLLPISYDVGDTLSIELTPEASYIGDRNDNGRHPLYGVTLGVDVAVAPRLALTAEYRVASDKDPDYSRVEHLGALSASFSPGRAWQLNAGAAVGLTRQSPKLELLLGFARRFR